MKQNKKVIAAIAITSMFLILIFYSNPLVHAQNQPSLTLNPSTVTVNSITDNIVLNFKISGVTNLWGWVANITWDTQYVTMVKAPIQGDFLSQADHQTTFMSVFNPSNGTLKGDVGEIGLDSGAQSGDGTLATFTFKVLKPVVSTTITINATHLYTNQTDGATVAQYTTPISPFPASTYASATVSYVPVGGAPIPDTGLNQTVNQHTNVILNASKTLPQDPNQNYVWTFFDNESRTLNGMIANYTFDWPGTFVVTLTVANSAGTANATMGINVKDTTTPVAIIAIDGYPSGQNIPVNKGIIFYSNQSYDPYNVSLTAPDWDFGDGSPHSTDKAAGHTYTNAGAYTVSLTVTNAAGYSNTVTKNIVVGDGTAATTDPNQTTHPNQTTSPTGTSSPSTSGSRLGSNSQAQFILPLTMLYPLVFVTVFVLGGAAFWLRKRT
jgi:hypothetical protein